MKTSNKILLGLFGLSVVGIIIMQLHLKSISVKTEEVNTIELQLSSFDKLNIESGWYVNIKQGDEFKISFTRDSIKHLIHVENNTLHLNEVKYPEITRFGVDVIVKDINDARIVGNSITNYYTSEIDSINLILNEYGRFGIYKLNEKENVEVENQDKNLDYLNVNMQNFSRLYVRMKIDELSGEMLDTCRFYFDGSIRIGDFNINKDAYFGSW